MPRSRWGAILCGGLIAGTVDVGAAAIISARSPVRILHFIAGGLLGPAALRPGVGIALLGLTLQWLMSILIATPYVMAVARSRALARRPISGGVLYGTVIFFVMNYIVVPSSAWHVTAHFSRFTFAANLVAMWVFGCIVGLFALGVAVRS